MTLGEYWDLLSKHDWTFDMSDDHSVWKRGQAEKTTLQAIARYSDAHQDLYDQWHRFVWKSDIPKPSRPDN